MDFYHSWIYINILNAKWFIWTIVVMILAFNILAPIIVWIVINGKKMPFMKNKDKKDGEKQYPIQQDNQRKQNTEKMKSKKKKHEQQGGRTSS